jgi:hypothetical protein
MSQLAKGYVVNKPPTIMACPHQAPCAYCLALLVAAQIIHLGCPVQQHSTLGNKQGCAMPACAMQVPLWTRQAVKCLKLALTNLSL